MKKENRVKITHTKEQWSRIDAALTHCGIKNIQKHITKELIRIDELIDCKEPVSDCVDCANKEQKIFWLNDSSNELVEKIKQKTGIADASSIISKFIINPLLLLD